ncbi:MAG TPA: helix-turn-helix domain-containing protein [Candidatus Woesearchaeota archaeon]|nr:helix-turn-helix domain-containing protein [Candidatus Woesearchaeota archaeon]
MLYFACKKIDFSELVRCSFQISKTEYKILKKLMSRKTPMTVSEIAQQFDKERTTIQKAVQNLHDKKLIDRRQINLNNGGYIYYYLVKDKDQIKKRIKDIVTGWYKSVISSIDDM